MNELIKICDETKKRIEKNSFQYWNWKGKKTERIITLHEALIIVSNVFSEVDFEIRRNEYKDSPFGKLIASLEEETSGWIPCKERLPEEEKHYLVQEKNGFIDILGFTKDAFGFDKYDFYHYREEKKPVFYDYDSENGFCECEVIAWQPLPEPYKEGK